MAVHHLDPFGTISCSNGALAWARGSALGAAEAIESLCKMMAISSWKREKNQGTIG